MEKHISQTIERVLVLNKSLASKMLESGGNFTKELSKEFAQAALQAIQNEQTFLNKIITDEDFAATVIDKMHSDIYNCANNR